MRIKPAQLLSAIIITTLSSLPFVAHSTDLKISDPNPSKIIFQIEYVGGYVPQFLSISRNPTIRLYEDGHLFIQSEESESNYFKVSKLTLKQKNDITTSLSKLVKVTDFGSPRVSDLPTTTITFYLNGKKYQSSIYAYGIEYGLTTKQKSNRMLYTKALANIMSLKGKRDYLPKIVVGYPNVYYNNNDMPTLANPASVFCTSLGYSQSTRELDQVLMCETPAGPIEQWEFYRSEAKKYLTLPSLRESLEKCVTFSAPKNIREFKRTTQFLESTGTVRTYALKHLLPNDKPLCE